MSQPPDPFTIPLDELVFRATRSGGPGGQHVNTSSTRAEIRWNVLDSRAITEEQRARLLRKLAARVDGRGWLRVADSGSRSQLQNRERATERLIATVAQALIEPKRRKKTKIPRAAKAKRLAAKRERGAIKQQRRRPADD
ncbi:MAG: alternative ribosome rescue aminoacyl-tRNA hydrolase ArfB [Gemmatimonadota bacterium]